MADQVRWGILSTANIGKKRVIPAIQQSNNGIVSAVASRDFQKAKAFAEECGIPQVYGSYEELLADPNIDAIYIPVPNSMHAEWAIKCAEAGKATLCEKPLASDGDEAQTMVDAFKARGILFAEAFMYRFHPQNQRAWQMIQEGAIGELQIINASFSFKIAKRGDIRLNQELAGGALMDVGCYCINTARFFTGEDPIKGHALAKFGESGVDEEIVGVLEFPSGVRAHLDASFNSIKVHTYELRGSDGRIVMPESFTPEPNQATVIHYWHGNDYEKIEIAPDNQYRIMVEDFADAYINKRPPRFDPQDGVSNMRAIDLLLKSARASL